MCGSDVKFKVLSRDSTVQVGTICKQWSGLLNELLTDADHFCISFPMDLDVNIKAVLLGAVFLIVSTRIDIIFGLRCIHFSIPKLTKHF